MCKLANLLEIDVYVLVACPENTLIDSHVGHVRPCTGPHTVCVHCFRSSTNLWSPLLRWKLPVSGTLLAMCLFLQCATHDQLRITVFSAHTQKHFAVLELSSLVPRPPQTYKLQLCFRSRPRIQICYLGLGRPGDEVGIICMGPVDM